MALRLCTLQILVYFFFLVGIANGLVHQINIEEDSRFIFKIESFGFKSGGKMEFVIDNFKLSDDIEIPKVGFLMHKAGSETAIQEQIEEIIESDKCFLDHSSNSDLLIDLSSKDSWKDSKFEKVVQEDDKGLYFLIFVRCSGSTEVTTSFKMRATFFNPGPNYLSAGETNLPLLFFCFCFISALALVGWGIVLKYRQKNVHHIHYMMLILLVFKTLSLLFEAIRYHYLSLTGHAEGWSIVYHVFEFIKGIMLFLVILLIGTGWSLLKAYLNQKEKKIIFVVLMLQVIDNIAIIILEESVQGSQGWLTWRDILHLIDIICCCAILLPIVWSIRHLREAATADGKSKTNLDKLTLFRRFYITVVSYVYFTRIIVFLLAATLPFELLYFRQLFTELATFAFYLFTGYQFRPADDNPYLPLKSNDSYENEMDDSEIEMQNNMQQRG